MSKRGDLHAFAAPPGVHDARDFRMLREDADGHAPKGKTLLDHRLAGAREGVVEGAASGVLTAVPPLEFGGLWGRVRVGHGADPFALSKLTATEAASDGFGMWKVGLDEGHLAVVEKPAGWLAHPTERVRSGTAREAPIAVAGLGLMHRLDRETSGLMVVARTAVEARQAVEREPLAGTVPGRRPPGQAPDKRGAEPDDGPDRGGRRPREAGAPTCGYRPPRTRPLSRVTGRGSLAE
jgi:hypothetical protein